MKQPKKGITPPPCVSGKPEPLIPINIIKNSVLEIWNENILGYDLMN